jgi:hypothetical protein
MKKILIAVLLTFASATAFADPAIILTEGFCGMFDGNGDIYTTSDVKTVFSNNSFGGNVTLKCYAYGLPNDTGKAVHYDYESTGLTCGTAFGATDNWKQVVDSYGDSVLTCKIRKADL